MGSGYPKSTVNMKKFSDQCCSMMGSRYLKSTLNLQNFCNLSAVVSRVVYTWNLQLTCKDAVINALESWVVFTWVFPGRLKISKIISIFEYENASLVQNYRPISILPAISNIFERAVYNRIFQFLVDNDILFKHQYGFRPSHSTSHALINLATKLLTPLTAKSI